MIIKTSMTVVFLFLLSQRPLLCQEAPATNSITQNSSQAAMQPPKLDTVFTDDFSKDTRSDYKVVGDVSWEAGKLTLAEGSSLERAINGGAWAKVELDLDLEHTPLTTEDQVSELRVLFMLDGATPCYVRLMRQLEGGKTVSSFALVDTREKDGNSIEQVVRSVDVEEAASAKISVEYRNGLVRIMTQNEQWLTAYIQNGSATVGSIMLQSVSTKVRFRNISATTTRANVREFTEAEQVRLTEASEANKQMIQLYGEGKLAAAAEIGERVIAVKQSVLGKQHLDYADSLNNLAVMYQSIGDFPRAESLCVRAMEIKKSILGEQHPDYATVLDNLAGFYHSRSDLARAEPLYKQALEINKTVLGEYHPAYARSLINLGGLYENKGDFFRAEPLLKQAMETIKSVSGEQHPDYARSLSNLGFLYYRMGDYARAEPLYKQALETRKRVVGEQNLDYATSLNNLAALCKTTGDFTRAEMLFKQALEIRKSALGEQNLDYAMCLNNLAVVYMDMNDLARAEPICQQSLAITKVMVGERHPLYASSLNNLALLYKEMGDLARAEPLLRQAVEINRSVLGQQTPEFATSLNNLASLYEKMGDSQRAEPLYKQALDIRKSVLGDQHPDFSNSLHNLAGLYRDIGDSARAEPLYKQALDITRSAFGEHHPSCAASLNNLASLYERMGDSARAEPLYQQALEIQKSVGGEQHPRYADSLNNLAFLYARNRDPSRAEPLFRRAMQIQCMNLKANAPVQSARQQDRNQASLRFYLDTRLAHALALESLSTEPLEDLWQWKGAVTTRQQAYRQVAANPQLAPLFEELQSVTRHLSALDGKRPVPPPESASDSEKTAFEQNRQIWIDRFATLSRQAEDLQQKIAAGSEKFRRIQEPLTVAEARKWLPAGTAFVDFLEYQHGTPNAEQKGKIDYERRYIAFVVRPDEEPRLIGLGSASSITEAISAFRRPLQADESTVDERKVASEAANQLRRELWLPIEAHLDGIDTVIISPDTALGTLPFAALPGKKDGSYLLEDYRIAMIPMASQLRELFERTPDTPSNTGLLVLGDVDYDAALADPQAPIPLPEPLLADSMVAREAKTLRAAHQGQWTSLSGFRAELDVVSRLYSAQYPDAAAAVLSGDKASEDEFLNQAPRFGTVHIITHGYFEDLSVKSIAQVDVKQDMMMTDKKGPDPFLNTYLPGLLSGLAMAGANRPSQNSENPNDGILRSSEIEASSMQGVDLVVLSACETGLGPVAGGEGLTGLQRAFQVAGARSVIASLWKVDDPATVALMTEFYTNLWVKKQSKIDALRNAQLAMLNHFDPVTNTLSRSLGTKPEKVESSKPDTRTPPDQSESRLDPAYWAAFQLSGDWR